MNADRPTFKKEDLPLIQQEFLDACQRLNNAALEQGMAPHDLMNMLLNVFVVTGQNFDLTPAQLVDAVRARADIPLVVDRT